MPYELSFTDDFFGDPWADPTPVEYPTTVVAALHNMSDREWGRLAREVFGTTEEHLAIDRVLARIQETNTCSNLDSPVRVWIDSDGDYTVDVYDEEAIGKKLKASYKSRDTLQEVGCLAHWERLTFEEHAEIGEFLAPYLEKAKQRERTALETKSRL